MTTFDYPYESYWYRSYSRVREYLAQHDEALFRQFESELGQLKIDKSFKDSHLQDFLNESEINTLCQLIDELAPAAMEKHEFLSFGRTVIHDHPELSLLHSEVTGRASKLAGCKLVPTYNFLSLYNNLGICELHLDAPLAQWTLDCCIRQTSPWPIHISRAGDWPADENFYEQGWRSSVMAQENFSSYEMTPGDALFFAGSSQWHYRDRIPRISKDNYCHLQFFHFINADCLDIAEPTYWASYFNCPAIADLIITPSNYSSSPEGGSAPPGPT